MKTVEDLTELNKIKLNQLFKYINNYIFQAIRNGKTCCVDIACTPLERKDDIRVRYIKLDYRIYLFK